MITTRTVPLELEEILLVLVAPTRLFTLSHPRSCPCAYSSSVVRSRRQLEAAHCSRHPCTCTCAWTSRYRRRFPFRPDVVVIRQNFIFILARSKRRCFLPYRLSRRDSPATIPIPMPINRPRPTGRRRPQTRRWAGERRSLWRTVHPCPT